MLKWKTNYVNVRLRQVDSTSKRVSKFKSSKNGLLMYYFLVQKVLLFFSEFLKNIDLVLSFLNFWGSSTRFLIKRSCTLPFSEPTLCLIVG